MKKHLIQMSLAGLAILLCTTSYSQSKTWRRLKTDVPVYECDLKGNKVGTSSAAADTLIFQIAREGFLFDSLATRSIGAVDFVVIKFIKFRDDTVLMQSFNYSGTRASNFETKWFWRDTYLAASELNKVQDQSNETKEYRYFLLRKEHYDNNSEPNEYLSPLSLTVGAIAIPFKTRWKSMSLTDFEESLSLGSVVGLKYTPSWLNGGSIVPIFGIAKTTITLDSLNTNANNSFTPSGTTERPGLTVASGIMYESSSGIQLMLNVGWDHLKRRENIDWHDNGKPWFGFGIGYSIFTTSKPTTSSTGDQKDKEE